MKKYLLVKGSYEHIAIPYENSARLAELVAVLADGQFVESKGYGTDMKYVPKTGEPIQMEFISAEKITIGNDVETLKAKLEDITKQHANYATYWTNEIAKTKKLEAEIVELKKQPIAAPDTFGEDSPI